LSLRLGICLGIVASRREGREGEAERKKQLLVPVLKPY